MSKRPKLGEVYVKHDDLVNQHDEIGIRRAQFVENYGARLRAARELRGISQRELAERLSMPASSIAHFEGNRRKPSLDNLLRLADALDVSADYLLCRTVEPKAASADDPIVRDISKLGDDDREIVGAILRILLGRRRARHS